MTDIQRGNVVVCLDAEPNPEWPDVDVGLVYMRTYRISEATSDGRGVRVAGVALPLKNDWHRSERFSKVLVADQNFSRQMRECKPKQRETVSLLPLSREGRVPNG